MSKKLEPLALPDREIKELKTQYRRERDRRIAERILCIILYGQDYDLKEIRQILLVGIKTLKKWIRTFISQGIEGLRQWGYKGQDCNLSDEQWAEVEEELERKPYYYAKQVIAYLLPTSRVCSLTRYQVAATSCRRCQPRQRVVTPGSPSDLRPRKPPS